MDDDELFAPVTVSIVTARKRPGGFGFRSKAMGDLATTTLPKMIGRDGQKTRRPKPKKRPKPKGKKK